MKTIEQILELIKLNAYSGTHENIQAIVELVNEARQPPYCIALVSGCPSSQINNKNGKETISVDVYLLKR